MSSKFPIPKQPPDKKDQVTKHTRRSIIDSKNAKILRHNKVKEVYCKCGGICNDKHCPCQKDNLSCGDGCRCSSDKCMNRIKRPDIRGFFLPPSKKPRPSSPLISESSNDIEDEDNDINCSTSTEGTSQDTSNKKNDTSYKCTMEVCPICILRLPTLYTGRKYMMCCGKVICSGCLHAPRYDDLGNIVDNRKCAFCRTRWPKSNREVVQSLEKRVELDDPIAIYNMGCDYQDGTCGRPQNHAKALELYHRAAELGYAGAYYNIGYAYKAGSRQIRQCKSESFFNFYFSKNFKTTFRYSPPSHNSAT